MLVHAWLVPVSANHTAVAFGRASSVALGPRIPFPTHVSAVPSVFDEKPLNSPRRRAKLFEILFLSLTLGGERCLLKHSYLCPKISSMARAGIILESTPSGVYSSPAHARRSSRTTSRFRAHFECHILGSFHHLLGPLGCPHDHFSMAVSRAASAPQQFPNTAVVALVT